MNLPFSKAKNIIVIMSIVIMAVLYFGSCTNDDQFVPPPIINTKDLVSINVTSPPTLDGNIDAIWENAPKLEFEAVVPDPSGDIFRGYIGKKIPSVTLRSMYDDENIYFLAEWPDPTESLQRQT